MSCAEKQVKSASWRLPAAMMLGTLVVSSIAAAADPAGRVIARGAESYGPVTAYSTERLDAQPVRRAWQPGDPVREIPRRIFSIPDYKNKALGEGELDRLPELNRGVRAPTIQIDVDVAGTGFTGATPPDTVGDIGPNHYVQAVNASTIRIFDKTGALVDGPFELDSLAPGGDPCTNGSGDPIVLYDHLADRWFLQEFTGGGRLCFYISQTPDPTGAYWFYGFTPPVFPDYPHYGVWPTGYFAGTNEGQSSVTTYAFDRAAMLTGAPATMQRLLVVPELPAYGFEALTPVDHDGVSAPLDSAGLFMRHFDDEAHGGAVPATDSLQMYAMEVDWSTPANTTVTALPSITISDYNSWFTNYTTFFSIPQPGTSVRLDPIREAILNRLSYRNFGSHETILGNFATNRDPATSGSVVSAGIRWFELRRVGGPGNPWNLFQEGTFGGDTNSPTAQFFMGGVAMDGAGNIALGYSKTDTSPAIFPSIGITGRLAGDAPGSMAGELDIVAGTAAQTGTGRWGDYAAMGIDPADDCTFWYTNEYMPGGSWGTRIVSFLFEECLVGFSLTPTPVTADVCAATDPDPQFSIDVAAQGGWTGSVTLSAQDLPPGTTAAFSQNAQAVDFTSVLTIQDVDLSTSGTYLIGVQGIGDDVDATERNTTVTLNLSIDNPGAPALVAPADAAVDVDIRPTLSWNAAADAEDYLVEVATDAGFSNIVYSATVAGTSHVLASDLGALTEYFWRVTAQNGCGNAVSAVRSFTTVEISCAVYASTDVPRAIPATGTSGTTSSTLAVPGGGGSVVDVDVLDLVGTHTWMNDLDFRLTSPEATTVLFMDRACGSADNFDINFDDSAAPGPWPCPPTDGGTYQPSNLLSAFSGEDAAGNWTLLITDNAGGDSGNLQSWGLRICRSGPGPTPVVAVADDYSVDEDQVLTVAAPGVLGNDTGGGPLDAAEVTPPSNGQLTLAADGGFSYTPDPDFCGSDSFTYEASDGGQTDTAVASIDVTCVNDAPQVADQGFAIDENSPNGSVVGSVAASDPDAGDTLAYAVSGGSGAAAFAIDAGSGEITVADAAALDFESAASFTLDVDVTDAALLTTSAVITITLNDVNEAVQAGTLADQAGEEGLAFAFDASSGFTDPDGDALTYSVDGLPASLSMDPSTGLISGVPAIGDAGSYAVLVTATDGSFSADAGFQLTIDAAAEGIFADGFESPN